MQKKFNRNRKKVVVFGQKLECSGELPSQYTASRQNWVCEVIVEDGKGVVEYEIETQNKIYLHEFLDIVSDEIDKLDEESSSSWTVTVYRTSNATSRHKSGR